MSLPAACFSRDPSPPGGWGSPCVHWLTPGTEGLAFTHGHVWDSWRPLRGAGHGEPPRDPGPPSVACLTLPRWTRAPAIQASWLTPESPLPPPKMRGRFPFPGDAQPGAGGDGAERAGQHPDVPPPAAPQDSWDWLAVSLPAPGGPRDRSGRQGPEARLDCAGLETGTKARTPPSLARLYTAHWAEEHHCLGGPAPAHSPGHPACVSPQGPGHRTSPVQNPRAATCGCFLGTRPCPQRSQEPALLSTGTGRATAHSQTQAHSPAADPRPEPCLV